MHRTTFSAALSGLRLAPALLAVAGCLTGALTAQDKRITLSFDTLPAIKPLGYWTPREVSNIILRALDKHRAKAAGFVVGEKIDDDTSTFIVLEDWASRGHLLGNQSYSNVDLNELSAEDFYRHVSDGEKYLWAVSKRFRFNFRYFRYPLLHEGNTQGKKKDVRRELRYNGYEIAPVSVKTSDHQFNRPYVTWERSPERLAVLKELYLKHLGDSLDYAEKQSTSVFGRNINHILWLHAGVATAQFLEEWMEVLRSRGYQFIPLTEALADPAYKTEEKYVGPLGLTFIDRVAATRGLDFDATRGELTSEEIERQVEASIGRQ
jgi:peptidoglycan/xylan/chitin deacetylase (PgdA/CDA1 family)